MSERVSDGWMWYLTLKTSQREHVRHDYKHSIFNVDHGVSNQKGNNVNEGVKQVGNSVLRIEEESVCMNWEMAQVIWSSQREHVRRD